MSGRIVGEVFNHAPDDLTKAQLLVLLVLAEDARDTTRTATGCPVTVITHRSRCSPGTVRNALVELTARGLIKPVLGRRATLGMHQIWWLEPLSPYHRQATHRVTGE